MKLLSKNLLRILSASELSNLKFQVAETLDIHFPAKKIKKFSSTDFWNIQKQKKTSSRREYLSGY